VARTPVAVSGPSFWMVARAPVLAASRVTLVTCSSRPGSGMGVLPDTLTVVFCVSTRGTPLKTTLRLPVARTCSFA
jgi:hypothetical protein